MLSIVADQLHTINQFSGNTFQPHEAREFVEDHAADKSIADPH
jgi:UDP-galactopyranose mutase